MNAAHSICISRRVQYSKVLRHGTNNDHYSKGAQCTHDAQEQSSEVAAQSAIAEVCDETYVKVQTMQQEAMAKLDHGWLRKGLLAQSFANQGEESYGGEGRVQCRMDWMG